MHPFSKPMTDTQTHLQILETTDLHAHIFPYDYYSDQPVKHFGLTRLASLIRLRRSEARNSLLFDNGDFLQGTPLGDYLAHEGRPNNDIHPFIKAMNVIGFDAAVPGNHEFNYGLEFLKRTASGALFPFVSANVLTKKSLSPLEDTHLFRPYTILEKKVADQSGKERLIRVGVIGFTPPQIMIWDHHLTGQIETRNILETAVAWVPEMKAAGADLIIALNHSGIGFTDHPGDQEDAGLQLAALHGIDVILCGHQHLLFPSDSFSGRKGVDVKNGTLHGKPAVMAGFAGSHLGVIDLKLDFDGNAWKIIEHKSSLCQVAPPAHSQEIIPCIPERPEVAAVAIEAHKQTLAYIRRPVGSIDTPLHNYFAFAGHAPSVDLICAAQTFHIRNALSRTEYASLPLLSASAPLKAGARGGPGYYTHVKPGSITYRDIADLYLYPDTICAVCVTGAGLRAWLERSAAAFRMITPGMDDQQLIQPDFPGYNFDIIQGVQYQIDPTRPAGFSPEGSALASSSGRIRNLTWKGVPVRDTQKFVVATNHYRASGGGNFPGLSGNSVIYDSRDSIRDILATYFRSHPDLRFTARSPWQFSSHPDTKAEFESNPEAVGYLSKTGTPGIIAAGPGSDGFGKYQLRFL